MGKYVISIDQGTTSSRAILFDHEGNMVCKAQREVECVYPHGGWVEADALSIWISVLEVLAELGVKSNISPKDIDSIGITNQRETTVVWDKNTGLPIYNAIVWQSRQSADICDKFADKKDFIHQKTGLLINPYFSASKIRFILDSVPGAQEKAEKGELLFGTIDSWLIYKMTDNKVHATDITNASRTLLFNINTLSWDKELCDLFNVPMCMLPEVKQSSDDYGNANVSGTEVRICGVAGDQQAALFGQTCFEKGESKSTYGTGCFVLSNIGNKPVFSKNGLLTTIAWAIDGKITYALEGSVFVAGAVVQWMRDEMRLIKEAKETETCAETAKSSNGVYVVPAFVGLGAPYWDDEARGSVFGLTRGTTKENFVCACLEAVAFQCKDVFEIVKKETKTEMKCLKVDGGASANPYLMQFQSDILETEILLPKCLETTALGVAYLAGLRTGFYKNCNEIKSIHEYQCTYSPKMDGKRVARKYENWKKAVACTRMFK